MSVLSGIDNDFNQTILNTLQLLKSKNVNTLKQVIKVVLSTPNQSICSHKQQHDVSDSL